MTDSNQRDPEVRALVATLAVPFDPKEIKWKAQSVKNNRALAAAYIDARLVQDRLDAVLGVENWQDRYDLLPDGSVMCCLKLRLGGRWISKTDVGSPSEQPDVGDRLKAAFSDALKRAAVKFGIGRYLYRLPAQWVDYDPVKKQLVQLPQLPAFALPKPTAPGQQQPKPQQQTPEAQQPPAGTPLQRLTAEAKRVAWTWAQAMGWLEQAYPGTGYNAKTPPKDVPDDRLEQVTRHLKTLQTQQAA